MKQFSRSLFGIVGLSLCVAASADDWPQWRGPERTGISKETGLLKSWPASGPKQLWQIDTPSEGFAAASVVGDSIYLTGSSGGKSDRTGVLYALSLDGKIKWEHAYGSEWGKNYPMARTSPTVHEGNVYIYSGVGLATCVDAKTGEMKWSVDTFDDFGGKNITWGIAESPLIVDDKVIVHPGGSNASVVALDKKTGKTVWTTKGFSEKSAYCSPLVTVLGGRKIILTQTENHIVGIDAASGDVLWKVPQRNKYAVHPNTPVVFGDRVFIASGYGYGCQMLKLSADGSDASVLWTQKNMDNHFQGSLNIDGRIYGSASRGPLLCLNPDDGSVIYEIAEVKKAAILYADERIYAYDEKGGGVSLVKVTPTGYEVTGSFRVTVGNGPHWAHMALANGVLYVRHGKAFMAYDVKE